MWCNLPQLTHLSITRVRVRAMSDTWSIFRCCPNIETLEFKDVWTVQVSLDTDPSAVLLASLHQFKFQGSFREFCPLLEVLQVPSLISLSLSIKPDNGILHANTIAKIIEVCNFSPLSSFLRFIDTSTCFAQLVSNNALETIALKLDLSVVRIVMTDFGPISEHTLRGSLSGTKELSFILSHGNWDIETLWSRKKHMRESFPALFNNMMDKWNTAFGTLQSLEVSSCLFQVDRNALFAKDVTVVMCGDYER